MKTAVALVICLFFVTSHAIAAEPVRDFNILDYGAVADGKTLNTDAFHSAMQACATAGGGRVVVPRGVFLTGPIQMMSHLDFHVDDGAVVLFSKKYADYPLALVNHEGRDTVACRSPIWGDDLENLSITGPGTFDGPGDVWRQVKKAKVPADYWKDLVSGGGVLTDGGSTWYPSAAARDGDSEIKKLRESDHALDPTAYAPYRELLRPDLLLISNAKHVLIDGPTFKNSPNWNLHPLLCDDLIVRNVTIYNPGFAQNGDGIDLDSCSNVVLRDLKINAGDDGICLKSGRDEEGRKRGRPTENVTVENCTVGQAHGGFVIGSEMSGGVRNVTVNNCTFHGTENGLRFKSTRGRGGVVENIKISNITMSDIHEDAITFDMYYMVKGGGKVAKPEPVTEGTPIFRNFQIENVTCNGAKKAILIRGLPEMPIEGVTMKDVNITADEGISLIDARDITLENVVVKSKAGEPMEIRNVTGLKQTGEK
jgi:polygalacturonase